MTYLRIRRLTKTPKTITMRFTIKLNNDVYQVFDTVRFAVVGAFPTREQAQEHLRLMQN